MAFADDPAKATKPAMLPAIDRGSAMMLGVLVREDGSTSK